MVLRKSLPVRISSLKTSYAVQYTGHLTLQNMRLFTARRQMAEL